MKNFTGIVSTLVLLSSASAVAQRGLPTVQEIRKAQSHIEFVAQDLQDLIANPAVHVVGGGQVEPVEPIDCGAIRTQRDCKIAYEHCTWVEDFEAPRCENKNESPFFENDFLAERSAMKLSSETFKVSNEMRELIPLRGTPEFAQSQRQICLKITALIGFNQIAREGARLPVRGDYKPEFFDEYEENFNSAFSSLRCR